MKKQPDKKPIDCFKCSHFYVTWDEDFPRGCRTYGFKTRNIPSQDVFESSGEKCVRYSPRIKEKKSD